MGNYNTSSESLLTRPEPIISFKQYPQDMRVQYQQNMDRYEQYDEINPERLTIRVGDKSSTIRSDSQSRYHLNKISGSGLIYLTCDNGQIYVHGNRSGRIALKPDKRGRYYIDFDDNGKVVFQSYQY